MATGLAVCTALLAVCRRSATDRLHACSHVRTAPGQAPRGCDDVRHVLDALDHPQASRRAKVAGATRGAARPIIVQARAVQGACPHRALDRGGLLGICHRVPP
eukprot:4051084-Prymnesium_polylepis.1